MLWKQKRINLASVSRPTFWDYIACEMESWFVSKCFISMRALSADFLARSRTEPNLNRSRHFTTQDVADLTFVIATINSWNRLAISFRRCWKEPAT